MYTLNRRIMLWCMYTSQDAGGRAPPGHFRRTPDVEPARAETVSAHDERKSPCLTHSSRSPHDPETDGVFTPRCAAALRTGYQSHPSTSQGAALPRPRTAHAAAGSPKPPRQRRGCVPTLHELALRSARHRSRPRGLALCSSLKSALDAQGGAGNSLGARRSPAPLNGSARGSCRRGAGPAECLGYPVDGSAGRSGSAASTSRASTSMTSGSAGSSPRALSAAVMPL
jgi:hypothetical protein